MDNADRRGKKGKGNLKMKLRFFFDCTASYVKNSVTLWLLALSVFSNVCNWTALLIFIKPVDLPVILHYNVYFGVDMIGNWKETFVSPLLGLFIILINFPLALFFYVNKERIASHILMIASLMIQLGLLVYSMSLIIINY